MRALVVYAVGSPYAWDVVESARRAGFDPRAVDNLGGADPRLPGLDRAPDTALPFALGLSSAEHRMAAAHAARNAGFTTPLALTDPSAVVASTATLGHGAYLNAGVVVASHSAIGCFANVNRSASVGHDVRLDPGSSLAPGAVLTGSVVVEAGASIGAGAVVLPGIRIGAHAVVGAGAVVTKHVAPFSVVVGNPARELRVIEAELDEKADACPYC